MKLLVAVLVLTAGACGFRSAPGEPEAPVSYGSRVRVATTTTAAGAGTATVATAAGQALGARTSEPPPLEGEPDPNARVANRSQRLDRSGVQLTLVSADAVEFRTTDRVTFELTYENRSGGVVHLDSNQELRFAMFRLDGARPEPAWSNLDCRASLPGIDEQKPRTGLIDLAPGETGRFVDQYPAGESSEQGFGPDPETCRVEPGSYAVVAYLDICPTEAISRADYNGQPYCESDDVYHAQSAPLALTLTG